jgi:hypothetical protein
VAAKESCQPSERWRSDMPASADCGQSEWLVYATACAKPNLKLRRVLERRGFTVREVPGKGECYHQLVELS